MLFFHTFYSKSTETQNVPPRVHAYEGKDQNDPGLHSCEGTLCRLRQPRQSPD